MVIALVGVSAFAQNNISWEANAGLNIAKVSSPGYSSRAGFHVGVRGKIDLPSISNGVYANAGALFSLKGGSVDWGDIASGKCNAYYLDIPVHIGYQHQVNDNFSVFGEFGPYFSFGLFGKTSSSTLDYDDDWEMTSASEKHDTFDEFKRFDFGLGFRLGTEIKQKYIFSIGYDFGLVNIWNKEYGVEDDEEVIYGVNSVKNKNFYISLGYKF